MENIIKIVPLWTKLPEFSFRVRSHSKKPLAQFALFKSQPVPDPGLYHGEESPLGWNLCCAIKTFVLIFQTGTCWGKPLIFWHKVILAGAENLSLELGMNNATFHLSSIHFDWRAFFMSLTSICNRSRIFFSSSNSDSNCLISRFCWSFMVSMMLLSSRTCVLSSSMAAWLLATGSIFGLPSMPNRDGELALCPTVPKEDDRGEDAAEDRGAGPPPPAAMVPGFGGRDALLSETWDMVTVFDAFLDASTPLCASETCSSLSSSGLGSQRCQGLKGKKTSETGMEVVSPWLLVCLWLGDWVSQ